MCLLVAATIMSASFTHAARDLFPGLGWSIWRCILYSFFSISSLVASFPLPLSPLVLLLSSFLFLPSTGVHPSLPGDALALAWGRFIVAVGSVGRSTRRRLKYCVVSCGCVVPWGISKNYFPKLYWKHHTQQPGNLNQSTIVLSRTVVKECLYILDRKSSKLGRGFLMLCGLEHVMCK